MTPGSKLKDNKLACKVTSGSLYNNTHTVNIVNVSFTVYNYNTDFRIISNQFVFLLITLADFHKLLFLLNENNNTL